MQQVNRRTNLYFRTERALLYATMAMISVPAAWSWSAHSILTQAALGGEPALQSTVQTEELLDFVTAERTELAQLLGEIEARAEKDLPATASDEPDYGLDIGLYANNSGPLGAIYEFGEQPFGNPALSYGSQAPFHNAYWGWRFAGLALHYVQDLAQPYHARMIPGQGTLGTLLLNIFGSAADRNGALMLLSNRHLVLETYAYEALKDATGPSRVTFETALAGTGGGAAPRPAPSYRRMWLYDVVAMGGYAAASELDTIVAHAFPARYVDDPTFDYGLADEQGTEPWDPYTGVLAESRARLNGALAKRYQALGGEIRSYIAYVSDPVAALHARKPSVDLRAPMYLASLVVLLGGIVALVIFMRPKRSA